MIKLICTNDTDLGNGRKAMQFTEGKEYIAYDKQDEESYIVADDTGKFVRFFDLECIFKIIE